MLILNLGKSKFPNLTVTLSSLLKNLPKQTTGSECIKHIPKCKISTLRQANCQKTLCASILDHVIFLTRVLPQGGPSQTRYLEPKQPPPKLSSVIVSVYTGRANQSKIKQLALLVRSFSLDATPVLKP